MNYYKRIRALGFEEIWANKYLSNTLWFGLSALAVIHALWRNKFNNFLVFRNVYFHLISGKNLYLLYPKEYDDVNLYGPVFGLIISPFALLPIQIGAICWVVSNCIFLYWAITKLPIAQYYRNFLMILCSHELMNNSSWLQSNAFVCGCIILGFTMIKEDKDHWALFFIILATFVKLYGIIGIVFYLFSNNKIKFIFWALFWSATMFFLPLLLTNITFLFQCYKDWQIALTLKDAKNVRLDIDNFFQDISAMGLIRRSIYPALKTLYILVPASLTFISQFRLIRHYKDLKYQLAILASCLIFVVIFSTGSESPTYIIALPGMCIWYFLQKRSRNVDFFFAIALLFTTFSYSDLLTPWFRKHVVMPYSLKALPALVIWIILVLQIQSKYFLQYRDLKTENSNT